MEELLNLGFTSDDRIVVKVKMQDGTLGVLFRTKKQFLHDLKGSGYDAKDETFEEIDFERFRNGIVHSELKTHKKGETIELDEESNLVKFGNNGEKPITVSRDGEDIEVEPGEMAMVGDIYRVKKDGIHLHHREEFLSIQENKNIALRRELEPEERLILLTNLMK